MFKTANLVERFCKKCQNNPSGNSHTLKLANSVNKRAWNCKYIYSFLNLRHLYIQRSRTGKKSVSINVNQLLKFALQCNKKLYNIATTLIDVFIREN